MCRSTTRQTVTRPAIWSGRMSTTPVWSSRPRIMTADRWPNVWISSRIRMWIYCILSRVPRCEVPVMNSTWSATVNPRDWTRPSNSYVITVRTLNWSHKTLRIIRRRCHGSHVVSVTWIVLPIKSSVMVLNWTAIIPVSPIQFIVPEGNQGTSTVIINY